MKTGKMSFVVSMAIMAFVIARGTGLCAAKPNTLFPTNLPSKSWVNFGAAGFSKPACGVIYRLKDRVSCGMPLGVIDTGCIDLETSGLWGYCSIFNTHVPRRGPLNLPFLGISVGGRTWVLCDPAQTKRYEPPPGVDAWGGPSIPPGFPITPERLSLQGVRTARDIHYWGHYPVSDLEYETDAPVSIGLRAWVPFLPGDIKHSLLPGSVFELHLRNPGKLKQKGTVAFSFPGPLEGEAGAKRFGRYRARGSFNGVVVTAPKSSYALGVIGRERLRLGGELGADGTAWARIAERLPGVAEDQPGASTAVDFALKPGETKVVRFLLAWHCPQWKGGGYNWREGPLAGNAYTHTYAKYYPSALEAARLLAREHKSLLRRILAWQEVIYTDEALPIWLRESLVNILHVFTEVGLWPQARPPIPDWVRPEDGLFGLNESPRDCPDMFILPNCFLGEAPISYFFPKLTLSSLRGIKGYQHPSGQPPFVFSGMVQSTPPCDFTNPMYSPQEMTCDSTGYLGIAYRYWLMSDEKEAFLLEFYPSLKKATIFMAELNKGDNGIISMPDAGGGEWYEGIADYRGMCSHVGGLHLATLRMAQRLAEEMGDEAFARQCAEWLEAGTNSMETRMWRDSHYGFIWDPKTDMRSDIVSAFQLDGQWIARSNGVPGVFRPDRVKMTLETIRRLNIAKSEYGVMNFIHPDGRMLAAKEWPLAIDPHHTFTVSMQMLAMNYMYAGQRDFGIKLAGDFWDNLHCYRGLTWDVPSEFYTSTGGRRGGSDYTSAMLTWLMPAALEDQDLSGPAKPGGLVDRVARAAAQE